MSPLNNDICLLLTATINPGGLVPALKRTDPGLREKDYMKAIDTWIQYGLPIVFCENSNVKSESILNLLRNSGVEFEYLTFASKQSHLGKGHGEFEIFEYAFEHSNIFREYGRIIKVTGRYTVKNFTALYQNCHTHPTFIKVNLSRNLTWADSRFFCFETAFWQKILYKFGSHIDEKNGVNFENLLAKATLTAIADGYTWSTTKSLPWLKGIYGTDDIKYKKNYVTYTLKNFMFKARAYLLGHMEF